MEGSGNNRHLSKHLFYQYAATLSAGLSMVCAGMHLGWPSISLPSLTDEDLITSTEGSWIAVIFNLVAPVGAMCSVILANRIGRKFSLLLTSPIFVLSWLIIAFARQTLVLAAARTLAGFAFGLAQTISPMYVAEIADKKIRGSLCSSVVICAKTGMLAIIIIGINFTIKITALIVTIIPIVHFATFWFMPETPRYYILIKKDQKAVASLNKFAGTKNADAEITQLVNSIRTESEKPSGNLTTVLSKNNRKALGLILCLFMVQNFSGYMPLTYYCLIIFNEIGSSITGNTATIMFFSLQLFVSFLCARFLDGIGRRPLLITSASVSTCALSLAGIYFYLKDKTSVDLTSFSLLPLVALLSFVVSSNMGLTFVPVSMMSEIFPIHVRAIAICLCNIAFGGFGTLATKYFQITKDEYGMHVPFLTFALCCGIGLVFIVYFVPETKGRSLEEIQMFMSNCDKDKKEDLQLEKVAENGI